MTYVDGFAAVFAAVEDARLRSGQGVCDFALTVGYNNRAWSQALMSGSCQLCTLIDFCMHTNVEVTFNGVLIESAFGALDIIDKTREKKGLSKLKVKRTTGLDWHQTMRVGNPTTATVQRLCDALDIRIGVTTDD